MTGILVNLGVALVALGLAIWFFRLGRSAGKNPLAWAAIGLASYYIPVFLCGLVLRAVVPSLGIEASTGLDISTGAGALTVDLAVGLFAITMGVQSVVLVRKLLLR